MENKQFRGVSRYQWITSRKENRKKRVGIMNIIYTQLPTDKGQSGCQNGQSGEESSQRVLRGE